jgi:acyl transferase domain-containing protein/surfactin synthase thioesterase subunit/acyl carrier protein
MACRFPAAGDPAAFWRNLRDGVDSITFFSDAELLAAGVDRTTLALPNYVKAAPVLKDVDKFDAAFFGYSPREAAVTDPQHRLFLEVAWEAFEAAGYRPDACPGIVGVFAGAGGIVTNYLVAHSRHPALAGDTATLPYIGNDKDFLATRVSYKLNLGGPSLTVQTACSTSLVAVHLACQSLLAGESDMALAGAATVRVPHTRGYFAEPGNVHSRDGRCRPFDANGQGAIFGSGVAAVLLKRLDDALAARDHIHAVIRGTAITNDGASKSTYAAPSVSGQARAMTEAFARADIAPSTVGYVECHAAGTPVGDPLEIQALTRAFGPASAGRCAVGSVKGNIGHPEQTAGLAALIKTALALQHKQLPPSLHFTAPNPNIDFAGSPFFVNAALRDWPSSGHPRRAGVNSLGIGGTNAFAVLEEAPEATPAPADENRPVSLFTLSAKSEAALGAYVDRFRAYLRENGGADVGDLCYTSNVSRSQFAHRLAVPASSASELAQRLDRMATKPVFRCAAPNPRRVAFLFTGQGSQHAGMAAGLYRAHPTFREVLDRCDAALRGRLPHPLLEVLFAAEGSPAALLDRTAYTQPALFALEYGLAQLWQSCGVVPSAVIGHSLGEVVAACVAGAMDFGDAVRFVCARGRLMQDLPERGAMAAVFAAVDTVRRALPADDAVVVAAANSPENTVVSGERAAVSEVITRLAAAGIESRPLALANGFHSPLVEPMLDALEAAARDVAWAAPRIPFVSNLTGATIASLDARYWRDHARFAVRFADGVRACDALGCDVFLEIGPGSTLLGVASQVLAPSGRVFVPSLSRQKPDWQALLEALQTLYLEGLPIDWEAVHRGSERRRCPLPTYPFQRKRFWVEDVHVESIAPSPAREVRREAARAAATDIVERRPHGALAVLRREQPEAEALPVALQARPAPRSEARTEWLHRVQWEECPRAPQSLATTARSWIVFSDEAGVGEALAGALAARGDQCHLVHAGREFGRSPAGGWTVDASRLDHFQRLIRVAGAASSAPPGGVAYLWALDTPPLAEMAPDQLQAAQASSAGAALLLARALGEARNAGSFAGRLHLLTRNAQRVAPDDPPTEALQGMLWGFGRTLALERRDIWGGLIDLPADGTAARAVIEHLVAALREPDAEDQIAFRTGRRFGARLVPFAPAADHDAVPVFRDDATYLITGGLGMIGLRTARWLIEREGVRSLVLAGRGGAQGAAVEVVEQLRHRGARVQVVTADVGRETDVRRLIDGMRGLPPLRGVIHAAGVLANAVVGEMDWERFVRVSEPKVAGAWLLHRHTLGLELDFFVLHSTVLSLIGAAGQSNYTAANAFLDGLAGHRRALGLPATVINWTAWAEAGLATTAGRRNEDAWRAMGLSYLAPDDGIALFGRLMHPPVDQAAVAIADWTRYVRQFGRRPALYARLADEAPLPAPARAEPSEAPPRPRNADIHHRRIEFIERVRQQVTEQMGFDEPIDSRRPLSELGLDSLMSVNVASRLEAALGIPVPVAKLIRGPSIERLVDDLAPELIEGEDGVAEVESAAAAAAIQVGTSKVEGDGWLVFPQPNPLAKVRLFCFPYAGGNAAVYRPWVESLRPDIELVAVDPPGRAARVHERPIDDFDAFFDALLPAMARLTDRPMAFYGHCLGGITLYEAARRLRAQRGFELRHLFVSSSRAPRRLLRVGKFEEDLLGRLLTLPRYDPFIPAHAQKDEVFAELIRRFNIGASEEFLANDELKTLLMPAIRAEFRMASRYRFRMDAAWDAPITCFVGAEDPYVTREDALAWSEHTRSSFKLHLREGDHFLVVDDREFIVESINRELAL